jgi:predicted nucleotidyltransferase
MQASALDTAASTIPGLTALQRETVLSIVSQCLPGAQAWVFGSRATGRYRPTSDLDLLFMKPDTIDWCARARLHDAFDASELPFRVDVVTWADLTPSYRARVQAEAKPL